MKIVALLALIFVISACSPELDQALETKNVGQVATPTTKATLPPILTPTLVYTSTATPYTQPTSTKQPTITPTRTRTPQPTLESLEVEKLVQQYMLDNGGCKLPC